MPQASDNQQFFRDLDRRLWNSADQLRSNLDAAVYKHIVLGLIFLKYVSDSFTSRRAELTYRFTDENDDYYLGGDDVLLSSELEVRDYYTEENIFWVPARARWDFLIENAKVAPGERIMLPDGEIEIYKGLDILLDKAMQAIEDDNPRLKNVLTKDFARLQLESDKLGRLLDLVGGIPFNHGEMKAKDILGHVYEFFLGEFASAEGKKGGQFYTPQSVVSLIVEMVEPYAGRIYDPCCGSGGFFVQSEKFLENHSDSLKYDASGKKKNISVYGQESNPTTWQLACMNLAIRGIEYDLGEGAADTLGRDLHRGLKADFIMANPPFNMKEWGAERLRDDPRWEYGFPPSTNANFAWVQHMLYHLAPTGRMALLLSNGSMSANTSSEGGIRRSLIEADLIECIVDLPGQLFTNTQIPACIWILTRSKHKRGECRDRQGETLFINCRNMGRMKDRVTKEFSEDDIARIAKTFKAWQTGTDYQDQPGYCKVADLESIKKHKYALVPTRYVGFADYERPHWNQEKLRAELFDVSRRVQATHESAKQALDLLSDLTNG